MLKLMGKKIFTILCSKIFFNVTYGLVSNTHVLIHIFYTCSLLGDNSTNDKAEFIYIYMYVIRFSSDVLYKEKLKMIFKIVFYVYHKIPPRTLKNNLRFE